MTKESKKEETKKRKPSSKKISREDNVNLDWFEELSWLVASNGYKVLKRKVADNLFCYVVLDKDRRVVVTVESPRDLRFIKHRRRGRKPKRTG